MSMPCFWGMPAARRCADHYPCSESVYRDKCCLFRFQFSLDESCRRCRSRRYNSYFGLYNLSTVRE
jgi:hypothetical protein